MTDVLARQDRALTPEETEALLRDRLGDQILSSSTDFATFTVWVAPGGWHAAAQLCRDESLLAYDLFDCLLGVDARDDGFDVVAVLYSTSTGNRICLRTRCEGGRDAPVCPSLTDVYRGADWMERETYDMFGIDFPGHPGLEPRILTVENFEGWPLRKDFHLASRVAKPWPGVNEPAELDDEGNVIEREPEVGGAPGPYDLDKAMAEQARAVNASEEDQEEGEGTGDDAQASGSEQQDEDEAPAPELDQETYDKLIAEGKSERIARSKAKAALIKKQRAGGGDTGGGGSDEGDGGDDQPSAAEKAEARRKEQAEARRKKAEERAAETGQDDDASDEGAPGADDEEEQA